MAYLVCDGCGGYYELQNGESAADFDICQCGGNLQLKDSIDDLSSDFSSNESLFCPNCGNYDFGGIYCSKCGGKLIYIDNETSKFPKSGFGDLVNTKTRESSNTTNKDLNISQKEDNINFNQLYPEKEPKNVLERINILAFVVGSGSFLLLLVIFAGLLFFSVIINHNYTSPLIFIFFINLSIALISLISGVLTGYIIKNLDYLDAIINGFIVGIVMGISLGIFFDFMEIIPFFPLITTIFTPLGGIIFIMLKTRLS